MRLPFRLKRWEIIMQCSRCGADHTPENQIIATEHGLLCPDCVRVVDAAKQYTYGHPPLMLDEQGVIIDPLCDPYAGFPKTHYLSDAFTVSAQEPLAKLKAVESTAEGQVNVISDEKIAEAIKKAMAKALDDAMRVTPDMLGELRNTNR